MRDRVFAAALVGVAACALSVAAAVQYGGTMWAFGWTVGIALVGVAIGIALGRRD